MQYSFGLGIAVPSDDYSLEHKIHQTSIGHKNNHHCTAVFLNQTKLYLQKGLLLLLIQILLMASQHWYKNVLVRVRRQSISLDIDDKAFDAIWQRPASMS